MSLSVVCQLVGFLGGCLWDLNWVFIENGIITGRLIYTYIGHDIKMVQWRTGKVPNPHCWKLFWVRRYAYSILWHTTKIIFEKVRAGKILDNVKLFIRYLSEGDSYSKILIFLVIHICENLCYWHHKLDLSQRKLGKYFSRNLLVLWMTLLQTFKIQTLFEFFRQLFTNWCTWPLIRFLF